jgi:hypothetical protein
MYLILEIDRFTINKYKCINKRTFSPFLLDTTTASAWKRVIKSFRGVEGVGVTGVGVKGVGVEGIGVKGVGVTGIWVKGIG